MSASPSRSEVIVGSVFCALALLAWGAGSASLLWSAGMAAALPLAACSPYRFHSSPRAKSRATEGTFVIIIASAMWVYVQRQSLQTNWPIHLLSLCPVFLFPKLLFGFLQASSEDPPSSALHDGNAIARRWLEEALPFSRGHLDQRRPWAFESVYYLLTLFIATFTLPARAGIPVAIVGAGLYALRGGVDRRGTIFYGVAWGVAALAISWAGAEGGARIVEGGLQYMESRSAALWSNRRPEAGSSANFSDTAIGRRGRIDNGSRLLMRLEQAQAPTPNYLRNGVFAYTNSGTTWFARPPTRPAGDRSIFPADGNSFPLGVKKPPGSALPGRIAQARISTTLARERSALALPVGSLELFGLPLTKLEINEMGVPTTAGTPGFVKFGISYAPDADEQPSPSDADLDVPLALQSVVDGFVEESKARGLTAPQAARAIAERFKAQWTYTLDLEASDGSGRSLTRFLRMDRRGHCEYFAAATTLALRRLGIPARYATGFLVTEFDDREKLYWVRARDAHAWSTYWDGSSWRVADSTPGGPDAGGTLASAGSDWLARAQYFLEDFDPAALLSRIDGVYASVLGLALALLLGYKLRLKRSPDGPDAFTEQAEALCVAIERLTKAARGEREATFDYWRRAASLLADPTRLLDLADAREAALFMPIQDRARALALCESLARKLRRSLARAPGAAPS